MPEYAILQSHDPDICPMTNKRVRDFAMKTLPNLDGIGKKHGVKVVSYVHLDPAHKAFMVLDARSAEAARDFLMEAGFVHFVNMEFYLVSQMGDLLKKAEQVPTLYE